MDKVGYIEYHRKNALFWEIDTHLDAAVYFAKKNGLSLAQRYWLAYLTACCETTPTASFLFGNFPNVPDDTQKIVDFTRRNYAAMAFQYDVRWILYKFGDVLNGYKAMLGNKPAEIAIPALMKGNTSQERFSNFTSHAGIPLFGTYVHFLYTELLHYLCGADISPVIDVRSNHSVRSGLIYALQLEDTIKCVKKGSKPTLFEYDLLTDGLNEIVRRIKCLDIHPRHKTLWAIETTLCTYNKYRHDRRWLGFYKARQGRELKRVDEYCKAQRIESYCAFLYPYREQWGTWNNDYDFKE